MKPRSEQFLRKRRFLTVLPLLVLPFLTLAFWALGGGQGKSMTPAEQVGFNMKLPGAIMDTPALGDKLSLYDEAAKDSMERQQSDRVDPFGQWDQGVADSSGLPGWSPAGDSGFVSSPFAPGNWEDPNERRVRSKLAELEQQLRQPQETAAPPQGTQTTTADPQVAGEIDQLQQMMSQLTQPSAPDPEMEKMSQVLDKIIDIQHPARAREKMQLQSSRDRGKVYTASLQPDKSLNDLLPTRKPPAKKAGNRNSRMRQQAAYRDSGNADATTTRIENAPVSSGHFFDLEPLEQKGAVDNSIPAVIHQSQTLVTGATVKMRLTQDIYLNGQLIPRGTFVFGDCSIDGERLIVSVHNIRYGNNLFLVSLSVFDLDGLAGVHIPGAISRDVAKAGADQAIQSLELYSMDPSLPAQAATAGVSTLKSLLSRKAKLVKVTVRGNYPVLLKDTQNQDD